jgi:uncharacterized membrane protein
MEFLLIVAMAGVLALVWNRMARLEARLAELETLALASEPAWQGDVEAPARPITPMPQEPEPYYPTAPRTAIASPSSSPEPATQESFDEESDASHSFVDRTTHFRPSFDFEEIFGRLLPIWGGGIALAIAGFFLVRWSIEMGMLTRTVRVAMSFGFGTALIAAAELAFRFEHRVSDERVRQALAGAGLATLYASFYLAGSHYGLIGPAWAFVGLAAVTGLAIILSFRFGLPSAVLGLVGGFAAPALAGSSDPNLPLLATYLALVTGGLAYTGQRQERQWLGFAALAGGLGWGALMLMTAPLEQSGVLALGAYLLLLGTILPGLTGTGPLGQLGRVVAAGLATLQIATLVGQSGYSLLAWGCYALMGVALVVLGLRHPRLREASAVAAGLSACLLAAWSDAPDAWFAAIASAFALIFAGGPLLHVWRSAARQIDWGQLALFPLALIAATCIQFGLPMLAGQHTLVALGALGLAFFPALGAWRHWPAREEDFAPGPFAMLASASVAAMLAGLLALPAWGAPMVTAVLSIPAFVLLRGRTDALPRALQLGIALSGLVLLLTTTVWTETRQLVIVSSKAPEWIFAVRWLAAALPFGLLLIDERNKGARRLSEILAAVLGYGAVAMLVPGGWLPTLIAGAVLGIAWRTWQRGAAQATLLTLGALWATPSLFTWSVAAVEALTGAPFLMGDLPALSDTLRFVVPLALALAGALLLHAEVFARTRHASWLAAFALAIVTIHVVFKQAFGIADVAAFAEWGLAERTTWQALLALVALGLAKAPTRMPGRRQAARAMAIAALAHFAVFSLLLHNPLWAEQAVGDWPIVNLLALSYALAIGLIFWLRAELAGAGERLRPAFDAASMGLITLLSLSELRQIYSGSMLLGSVGQQEDLLRSLLAIAIALGFLGWGSRSGQRSWRIGSLVLMLLAVLKVFIFDAAELEGLARIASFLALGICLIGIGWFYSRQLRGASALSGRSNGHQARKPE